MNEASDVAITEVSSARAETFPGGRADALGPSTFKPFRLTKIAILVCITAAAGASYKVFDGASATTDLRMSRTVGQLRQIRNAAESLKAPLSDVDYAALGDNGMPLLIARGLVGESFVKNPFGGANGVRQGITANSITVFATCNDAAKNALLAHYANEAFGPGTCRANKVEVNCSFVDAWGDDIVGRATLPPGQGQAALP